MEAGLEGLVSVCRHLLKLSLQQKWIVASWYEVCVLIFITVRDVFIFPKDSRIVKRRGVIMEVIVHVLLHSRFGSVEALSLVEGVLLLLLLLLARSFFFFFLDEL